MKIGGRNSRFESFSKESVSPLLNYLEGRQDEITSILLKAFNRPSRKAYYWRKARASIKGQYILMDKAFKREARKALILVYNESVKELKDRLNRNPTVKKQFDRGRKSLGRVKIQALLSKETEVIQAMYIDAIADWERALSVGKANIDRVTRKTKQKLVEEFFIDQSVAEAYQTGDLMNNTFIKTVAMDKSLASLLKDAAVMIDNKWYVQAGSKRYSPKYYADMVTRTKFHEAQSYAAINTALAYGTSLVQVSNHNTTTAVCQQYEGKIFSINGEDPNYEQLGEAPPFHPNCLHLLYPVFVSGLAIDAS